MSKEGLKLVVKMIFHTPIDQVCSALVDMYIEPCGRSVDVTSTAELPRDAPVGPYTNYIRQHYWSGMSSIKQWQSSILSSGLCFLLLLVLFTTEKVNDLACCYGKKLASLTRTADIHTKFMYMNGSVSPKKP